MDGLVFAAGEGTRLRPLTADRPKPLLDVGGRSILERGLETLVDLGADRLIVVVGYRGDQVIDHVGDAFEGVPVVYARQEERLGMAHALLAAEEHVEGDLVTMDGDCLIDADLSSLVERHHESGVDGTLLVNRVSRETARSKAICDVDDDGRLREIVNKPEGPPEPALVAAGAQTSTPALLAACREIEQSPRGEYELAAAIQRLVDRGRTITCVEAEGWHVNVNTAEDLETARAYYEE